MLVDTCVMYFDYFLSIWFHEDITEADGRYTVQLLWMWKLFPVHQFLRYYHKDRHFYIQVWLPEYFTLLHSFFKQKPELSPSRENVQLKCSLQALTGSWKTSEDFHYMTAPMQNTWQNLMSRSSGWRFVFKMRNTHSTVTTHTPSWCQSHWNAH